MGARGRLVRRGSVITVSTGPRTDGPFVTTVFGLFAESATRTPDAVACVDASGGALTYRELLYRTMTVVEFIKENDRDRQP